MKAPPSVDILDGLRDGLGDFAESRASQDRAADLVVNGNVVETKLSVYGKVRMRFLFVDAFLFSYFPTSMFYLKSALISKSKNHCISFLFQSVWR